MELTPYDIPALMDAHPTISRADLWLWRNGRPEESRQTDPLATGIKRTITEEASRRLKTDFTTGTVAEVMVIDPQHLSVAMHARMDSKGDILLPIHISAGSYRWQWKAAQGVPVHYRIQMQTMLMGYKSPRGHIAVLVDRDIHLYTIDDDPDLASRIRRALEDWAGHLRTNTPPPIDIEDGVASSVPEIATEDVEELVRLLQQARKEKGHYKSLVSELDRKIEAMENAIRKELPAGTRRTAAGMIVQHTDSGSITIRPATLF